MAFVAELETKQEFKFLNTLVQNPDASPADTVQQIRSLTLASAEKPDPDSHLYYTACGVLEVAARTSPAQQRKLIAVIHQLQSIAATDPTTGTPLRHDGDLIFTDLPTFGYTFSDELGSFSNCPLVIFWTEASVLIQGNRSFGFG